MANKISIILPMYNSEKTIDKCLKSIINQTYKDFEVVIINDGSTDNSLSICNAIIKDDIRFKIFSQKNSGVSAARNFALSHATGEYVFFIDADDYIDKNSIQLLINEMDDADVIAFGYRYHKVNENIIEEFDTPNIEINQEEAFKYLFKNEIFIGALWNKIFKRECIKEIEFDRKLKIGEDLLFQYEALKNVQKIKILDNILYNYVISSENVTNSSNEEDWMQFEMVTKYFVEDTKYDKTLKKFAVIKYIESNFFILNKFQDNNDVKKFCIINIKKYIYEYIFSRDKFLKKIKNIYKFLKNWILIRKENDEKSRNCNNNR